MHSNYVAWNARASQVGWAAEFRLLDCYTPEADNTNKWS
jgi:hypothetical protein